MTGRASKATEQARAAFEKSGGTLKVLEMCHRFKLSPSTIYRAKWYTKPPSTEPAGNVPRVRGRDETTTEGKE